MSEADPPNKSNVGYGRPPVEHQFKKGVSGNPKGRPRKSQKVQKYLDPFKFSSQPGNQLFVEELYRTVSVKENGEWVQMSMLQAIFRSLATDAAKGNRFAMRFVTEGIQKIENSDLQDRRDFMQSAIEYKSHWEQIIDDHLAAGLTPPEPVPHPDDIIIDFSSSKAEVCGPLTKEDKATWDRILTSRDRLNRLVSDLARCFKKARNPEKKKSFLEDWMLTQRKFDKKNDNLPRRYRTMLNDRCWEDGASMPGSQKTLDWPGG